MTSNVEYSDDPKSGTSVDFYSELGLLHVSRNCKKCKFMFYDYGSETQFEFYTNADGAFLDQANYVDDGGAYQELSNHPLNIGTHHFVEVYQDVDDSEQYKIIEQRAY